MNTIGRIYAYSEQLNKCAILIPVPKTKLMEVQFWFMLHQSFVDATQVILCKSKW